MGIVARCLGRPELSTNKKLSVKLFSALMRTVQVGVTMPHPFKATVAALEEGVKEKTGLWKDLPSSVNGSDKLVQKYKELVVNLVLNHYVRVMRSIPGKWWEERSQVALRLLVPHLEHYGDAFTTANTSDFFYP